MAKVQIFFYSAAIQSKKNYNSLVLTEVENGGDAAVVIFFRGQMQVLDFLWYIIDADKHKVLMEYEIIQAISKNCFASDLRIFVRRDVPRCVFAIY